MNHHSHSSSAAFPAPVQPDRSFADSPAATSTSGTTVIAPNMGPLEFMVYREDWRASYRYRDHVATVAAEREHELLLERLKDEARPSVERAFRAGGKRGFEALRAHPNDPVDLDEDEFEHVERPSAKKRPSPQPPVTAARVVARLLLARLFDARPDLKESISFGSPVITIDVPEPEMLDRVLSIWEHTVLPKSVRVLKLGGHGVKRDDYDLLHLAVKDPPTAKLMPEREKEALAAISCALPIIAISPSAEAHLPRSLLKTAPIRLTLPALDPTTVACCIRIVTGSRCRDLLDLASAAALTTSDLVVGVRFDRTPAECMIELRRLLREKRQQSDVQYVPLDEIYGMDAAVTWARELKRDLQAWYRNELPWSSLSAGVCLEGPPGTGKTMFVRSLRAFLSEGGPEVELSECTLAGWQGRDQAHLGTLLRSMQQDFALARSKAKPTHILFIDEVDSFADRSKVKHSHSDYVVEVVNGALAQLSIVCPGLLLVGASNDLSRCDPAILRSGRLGRILRIGLPGVDDLERMFRVRLASRLATDDLEEICLLALGSTGADVERIVNDAARFARHAGRSLAVEDLRRALVDVEDRRPAEIERAAFHEAGHLLAEVVLFEEPANVHASIAKSGDKGGVTVRTQAPPFDGTYDAYFRRLQMLLAGRAAETLMLSAPSHGAGGREGSDLQRGASLAAAMCASLGIAGPAPLLFLGNAEDTDELLSYPEVRAAANAELRKAFEAVTALLTARRSALSEIAGMLVRVGRVDGVTAIDLMRRSGDTEGGR